PQAWVASAVTFWALRPQDLYRGTIPAKLYEAMASGTPSVAATEGVAGKLITASGGGFAFPFGDVEGMTSAMLRLLEDDALRQQTSTAGRAYAEQHFDAEQVIFEYESVMLRATTGCGS